MLYILELSQAALWKVKKLKLSSKHSVIAVAVKTWITLTLILETEYRLADELAEMSLDLCLMLAMTISFLSTSSHPQELISETSTRHLHKNTAWGGPFLQNCP